MNQELISKNKLVLVMMSLAPIVRAIVCGMLLYMNKELSSTWWSVYVAIGVLLIHAIWFYKLIIGLFEELVIHWPDDDYLGNIQQYLILAISLVVSSSIYLLVLILLYIFNKVGKQHDVNDYLIFIPMVVSSLVFIYVSTNTISYQAHNIQSDPVWAKQQMIQKLAFRSLIVIVWFSVSLLMLFGVIPTII